MLEKQRCLYVGPFLWALCTIMWVVGVYVFVCGLLVCMGWEGIQYNMPILAQLCSMEALIFYWLGADYNSNQLEFQILLLLIFYWLTRGWVGGLILTNWNFLSSCGLSAPVHHIFEYLGPQGVGC